MTFYFAMKDIHMRFNRDIFVSLLPYRCVLFNDSCHNNLVCSVRTPYFWGKSAFIQPYITSQPLQLLKKLVVWWTSFSVLYCQLHFSPFLHHTLPPDRDPAEYQCSIPCKYMIGSFSFFHTCKAFGPCSDQITILVKSVNTNIWKAKSEWKWISMIDYGYSTFYFMDIQNSIMYVRKLRSISQWSWIFKISFVSQRCEYMENNSEWSSICVIIYGYP